LPYTLPDSLHCYNPMKNIASITFSNSQITRVQNVNGIGHAENVANVLASRFSAYYGKPVFVESVVIDKNNFTMMMSPEMMMEGVEVLTSIGG
jgi:hypothetical protein